jgi:hypothetical protein
MYRETLQSSAIGNRGYTSGLSGKERVRVPKRSPPCAWSGCLRFLQSLEQLSSPVTPGLEPGASVTFISAIGHSARRRSPVKVVPAVLFANIARPRWVGPEGLRALQSRLEFFSSASPLQPLCTARNMKGRTAGFQKSIQLPC